jgi:hypothetical protein
MIAPSSLIVASPSSDVSPSAASILAASFVAVMQADAHRKEERQALAYHQRLHQGQARQNADHPSTVAKGVQAATQRANSAYH